MSKKFFVLTSFLLAWTANTHAATIAVSNGGIQFNSALYASGLGSAGDANFIQSGLGSYGTDVIIKVTIGEYIDYYKPEAGVTLLEMLQSQTKHLWLNPVTGEYVEPRAYSLSHLGGGWNDYNNGDGTVGDGTGRRWLNYWGSDYSTFPGGCCKLDPSSGDAWGRAFTVESVSAVPIPAAAWLFGSALFGLVALKRRKV